MRILTALFAILALVGAGCTSPGTPYHYNDLKVLPIPLPTPLQPLISDPVTINFAIFNTDTAPVGNVVWRVYLDSPVDTPTGGTLLSDNTIISLGAMEQAAQVLPLAAPGVAVSHTYTVVVDPDNTIAERDETNNVASVTVTWSDYDLSYSPAPTFTPANPLNSDQITLSFSILNTSAVGGTAPSANVNVQVLENSLAPVPVGSTPPPPTPVTPVGGTTLPVAVAAGATVPVTIVLPATTVGTHSYSIVLTPDVVDQNSFNDTVTIIVVVGAPG